MAKSKESWYDLKAGIYKYKIEVDFNDVKSITQEGDIRLQACTKTEKEITE